MALVTLGCTASTPRFSTSDRAPSAEAAQGMSAPVRLPRLTQSQASIQGEAIVRSFFAHFIGGDLSRLSLLLSPGAEVTPGHQSASQPALPTLQALLGAAPTSHSEREPFTLGHLEFLDMKQQRLETNLTVWVGAGNELAGKWEFTLTQGEKRALINHILLPKPYEL